MYRIVYTKQAVKDIKNLKSVRLAVLAGDTPCYLFWMISTC